jgi:hypothetical protein
MSSPEQSDRRGSVAVRGKPAVCTDRTSGPPGPVRYASVDMLGPGAPGCGAFYDVLLTRHPAGTRRFYRQYMTVEAGGECWEPVPGATVTAQEFIAARSVIDEIHQQIRWSPWGLQDRAGDYDAALAACGQWATIGPQPPPRTLEQYQAELDQRLAAAQARLEARQTQAARHRAVHAGHYDPERAAARLALLEEQAILAGKVREREDILSGELFPLAPQGERRELLDILERAITRTSHEVDALLAVAGDPETVADARGALPAERREEALLLFKARRGLQVRDLRARIASAQATLKTLTGRPGRAGLREGLRRDQAHLAYWEQMPPLDAGGMCPECGDPAWHAPGTTYSLDGFYVTGGPCPAWPRWAKNIAAARQAAAQPAQQPPPPPPEPIAVLAPGVPVDEVITQLTAIQAAHPGAQIRQGRGHRWEIWPAPKHPGTPGHRQR